MKTHASWSSRLLSLSECCLPPHQRQQPERRRLEPLGQTRPLLCTPPQYLEEDIDS